MIWISIFLPRSPLLPRIPYSELLFSFKNVPLTEISIIYTQMFLSLLVMNLHILLVMYYPTSSFINRNFLLAPAWQDMIDYQDRGKEDKGRKAPLREMNNVELIIR